MLKIIKNGLAPAKIGAILGLTGLIVASLASGQKAFAASMSSATVLESNMVAGGNSLFYVDFKAGANDLAGSLTITWPAGFTVAASQTPSTGCTSLFSGSIALPSGTSLSAAGSGQVVTVSNVSALTTGTQYCVGLTGTNPIGNATAGTYTVALSADGSDSTNVIVDILSGDTIGVTATVAPTFTLSFNGSNSDALGTLSNGSLTTSAGVNLSVSTNAANGWGLWAEDTQAGLHSTAANKTIATVATGSNHTMNGGTINTEAYGLGVTTANATANYADAGGITAGGLSSSAYNEIASAATPGSGVTVTVKELADIAGSTPAGPDYSDTITIVGDGSF